MAFALEGDALVVATNDRTLAGEAIVTVYEGDLRRVAEDYATDEDHRRAADLRGKLAEAAIRAGAALELKIWPEQFRAVRDGQKRHEVRKADRAFVVGMTVALLEFVTCERCDATGAVVTSMLDATLKPCEACKGEKGQHTGEFEKVVITHLTPAGSFGLPPDLCVWSFRKADELP